MFVAGGLEGALVTMLAGRVFLGGRSEGGVRKTLVIGYVSYGAKRDVK